MTTLEISKMLCINHYSIFRLATEYKKQLQKFGKVNEIRKSKLIKGGRPITYYDLNEKQKMFLIMLTRNNKETVKAKLKIIENLLYRKDSDKKNE